MTSAELAAGEVTFHLQDEALNAELHRIASQYPGFIRLSFTGRLHTSPKQNLSSFTIQAWYEGKDCIGVYGVPDLAGAISKWYVELETTFNPAIAA